MRIVLLGAPGSGKGTQCKRVAIKYGVVHMSSGDILRRERTGATKLGKKAQSYMDSGALVPDDVIVEMMTGAITKASKTGFVLDGFPRTVNQAQELDKSLARNGQKIDAVLNLKINDKVIADRMTGRRSCPKCGAVYHVKNLKPKVSGVCDIDGVGLVQRPDDTLEVVKNRLKTYHQQTEPVVGHYKKSGTVMDIDANESADEVTALIFEKLESLVSASK